MAEIAETLNNFDPLVPYWSALKLAVEENKMPELHEINYSMPARLKQPRLQFSGPSSYRWFSETSQNEASQPAEITFRDERLSMDTLQLSQGSRYYIHTNCQPQLWIH